MSQTVYVLMMAEHDEVEVGGIFSTTEKAAQVIESLSTTGAGFWIDEWEIDKIGSAIQSDGKQYVVRMDETGNGKAEFLDSEQQLNHPWFYRAGAGWMMQVIVVARNARHAIGLANSFRIEALESGTWGP